MAQVKKAKNLADWFDQRLGTNKLIEVMMNKILDYQKILTGYGLWVWF